jgi:mono/diheme cytochrome c family protein
MIDRFFHEPGLTPPSSQPSVTLTPPDTLPTTGPSGPTQARQDGNGPRPGLITALLSLAAVACIVLILVMLPAARNDPYTRTTLDLTGSVENGGRLFRLNCAGCHGLAAQGLVGPDLHGVVHRKNDRRLIQQVVSGRTPPMPRFQPEPQAMADLLAFLHSLP